MAGFKEIKEQRRAGRNSQRVGAKRRLVATRSAADDGFGFNPSNELLEQAKRPRPEMEDRHDV